LNQCQLLYLLASDFPSENPRAQTRNFQYTKPLGAISAKSHKDDRL
ncbi:hypothetical protein DFQ02_1381, partial [Seonamhaeicola aphaedonensis]